MKLNKNIIVSVLVSLFMSVNGFCAWCETAENIKNAALGKETVQETIEYIQNNLSKASTDSDKRSLLYFMGLLQEQSSLFNDASLSYAKAAGIGAQDAKNMPKISSEELVLCAVRCALNVGDADTAERYLNSAVRSSRNERVLAYVNLYSVWVNLCRAETVEETQDSIALLKAYASMQTMSSCKPAVLLTLWYLTDGDQWANLLKTEAPNSAEYGIVSGKVQIMTTPFWFFVPRNEHNFSEGTEASSSVSSRTVESSAADASSQIVQESQGAQSSSSPAESSSKLQLGFFSEKSNAEHLVESLKAKGFDGYIVSEKRASGKEYYIVLVNENGSKDLSLRLKDAGFECVPYFE